MMEIAKKLSPLHQADLEIVLLGVLLHDYAAILDERFVEQHHIYGADEARKMLSGKAYSNERILVVEDAIRAHRGSVPTDKTTREARCLADCDAVSHIQQFPSLFYVIYAKRMRTIDDGIEWVKNKLERDWSKLSPVGHDYIREVYDGLMNALSAASAAAQHTSVYEPEWESP